MLCNFLTTDEDRASVLEGVRIALEIASQPSLRAIQREPLSVPDSDSEKDILAWVERASQTVYHPTSTCAMGSVVDAELRVHGVEGLRVADASVMPTDHAREHERGDDHDRREGGGPDPREGAARTGDAVAAS